MDRDATWTGGTRAYRGYVTELVPTDCEEFKWVYEVADHWDVPEAKDYDRHGNDLVNAMQRA